MKKFLQTTSLLLFVFSAFNFYSQELLSECRKKMLPPGEIKNLSLQYTETLNELYHSPEPWQQLHYSGKGIVNLSASSFNKSDTLSHGKREFLSVTSYIPGQSLLIRDYGSKELKKIRSEEKQEYFLQTARYSPMLVLDNISLHKKDYKMQITKAEEVWSFSLNKNRVKLFIRKTDQLVSKIEILSADDLHGDVLITYLYDGYKKTGAVHYPGIIRIKKFKDKIEDFVTITTAELKDAEKNFLGIPADNNLDGDSAKETSMYLDKYNEHIRFGEFKEMGDRVLIVEFKDFFLVEGAPLSPVNGESIIAEINNLRKNKPVRYFTFGHHHPHYLGGMRAFIHKNATVLTIPKNEEYVRYLATAEHSIDPDSLQLQKKELKLRTFKDSVTISDGTYKMQIFFIGDRSGHTSDYLIYYFPEEKLLYEDDLVWIAKEGEMKKAGKSQSGLYNAIKELNLDVQTIVQGWGTNGKYKMTIPFEDLRNSMEVK